PLTLSFRSVPPVLHAVDRVFADPQRTPGLSAGSHALRHEALRMGQGGLVEIWPTEKWTAPDAAEPWSPLAETGSGPPANRLAQRIAATIAHWLRGGERLSSEDRPIRAGDILILVRKRRPFAGPMVAALKGQRIPVAGADRLDLTEQIAVMDLMALADFLTLPEDDLALAEALKSPLFGFDDDDLLALAQTRTGTLWTSLLEAADSRGGRYAGAAATLKRWRALAELAPPYELFAGVLDRDGGRRRLLERLGSEAADPLTEFLSLALEYEGSRPASLVGFLDWLRSGGREIKRDMEHGRDEVRVLTVHGAKGLEAPIVFLPDTCSGSGSRRPSPLIALHHAQWPKGPPPLVWQVKGATRLPAVRAARTAAANEEAEEDNRLLYVAMTRARDRLYVAGFEGARGRSAGCWYDKIEQGLADVLSHAVAADGKAVRRLEGSQIAEPEPRAAAEEPPPSPVAPPDWARRPAPTEPLLAVPIAPSRLAPLDFDQQGEPVDPRPGRGWREPASPSPLELAEDHRFLRGTLTHALLEHLPTLPRAGWERAARAFLERRGRVLAQRTRESIVAETLGLLNEPAFAPVFGPASRAEVPIVADIPSPRAGVPPLRLSGQIDRLVALDHAIMILDYKTNRPPPESPEEVAPAYLYQLAAYALAVQQVFRARDVRAAILWTDGPRLMEIPATIMRTYGERLWQLPAARLDG
ncbi:MAG TPA: 3'-5' exonuclease, partial [Hyphomicrobiaceae bacterium]|nr:3'-5' exonuclease [Hyphomicrobiaceae bacterium]